jgi:hypothetical protein
MKPTIKMIKKPIFILLFLAWGVMVFTACRKDSVGIEKWECVLKQYDITITLTIDPITHRVTEEKSPKEIGTNDSYHQFTNGYQYFLQNDTLYYLDEPTGNVLFDLPAFSITKQTENTMELEYLRTLPANPLYIRNYLFNRKID